MGHRASSVDDDRDHRVGTGGGGEFGEPVQIAHEVGS